VTYPNTPIPPWTPEMQALWNKAMEIERTRGAYGVGFPAPGTTFKPPAAGTMLHTILFVATAQRADVEDHLRDVRENMEGWKARVRDARGKNARTVTRHEPAPNLSAIDLGKLEFKL
jgi:hypothetical protein